MKRIVIILLALLYFGSAQGRSTNVVVGQKIGGAVDPCGAATATYMMVYTGDYSGDTDKACFTNGTASKDSTNGGTPTFSADYVEFTAANVYASWAISGKDGFDSAIGTLCFTVTIVDGDANTDVDANYLIEIRYDPNNYLTIGSIDVADKIQVGWKSNSLTTIGLTSATSLTLGNAFRVCASWDAANDHIAYSMVAKGSATSWQETTSTNVDVWAAEPTDIKVGEYYAGATNVDINRVADLYIFSTYQATDPNQ